MPKKILAALPTIRTIDDVSSAFRDEAEPASYWVERSPNHRRLDMPNITSGNTNAPTMMIAEKGAEMVLQDRVHK